AELVARVGGEEFAWILPECDAGELYRLADSALYWAKGNGRDQVCVYSPEMDEALSVAERAQRIERTQALVALRSLARAVDAKDSSTKAHSDRVAAFSQAIALALGWPPDRATALREAALLHDVGKIGVPDAILFKDGPLDDGEYEIVRRHADLGAEITSDALSAEQCGWIRHHHEHWSGRGYPDGLAGEAIPEGARIIAVADAWDAMTRARHYGAVRSAAEALAELERMSGVQFWPAAAQAMARLARGPRTLWAA
ncbi:MAG TPA: HD domain-containing phosphohydrolase, partial [Miltoncostaeaceae bacterium]|nr:HD domain-containing phosphohydrolase [Miltoncostaeaceae bacterium]